MKRSRGIRVVMVVLAIAVSSPLAWGKYGGGSGTEDDPYLIYTADDLHAMSVESGDWGYYVHYKLMADINMADLKTPMQPIGTADNRFTGIFHGNGKTISNLKITGSWEHAGLFGYAEVEVSDLRLVNVEIYAPQSNGTGAIAGWSARKIERCCVEGGSVTGRDEVGGLSGTSLSSISQCYTTCKVSGNDKVGGLFGSYVGGGTISECYSTAAVSGAQNVGGLVGNLDGILSDCYTTGKVQGSFQIGGLIGWSRDYAVIWDCYAVGRVQSYYSSVVPGGLSAIGVLCFNSFWDVNVAPRASANSAVGKTTAELRKAATFLGWGHNTAWTIEEGVDYPKLAWEKRPGLPLTTPAFPQIEGQGTSQSPYVIRTAQEFDAVARFPGEWDKHYRLEADIDLAVLDAPHRMLGHGVAFTGTFDGNGHSISNFKSPVYGSALGLFSHVIRGTIKRLLVLRPQVGGETVSSAGGLVGAQSAGTVEACGVEGGSVSGMFGVGGLVGQCMNGKVTRSYSTCAVTGLSTAEHAGGLIGSEQYSNINNSYATGEVSGKSCVGGLVGFVFGGSMSHCYSTGRVNGLVDVGGLIGISGEAAKASITACFWDTQTSGLVTSAAGRGLSTAELQKAATFLQAGWDLTGETRNGPLDIWCIDEGKGYPQFFHEPVPEPPTQRAWADDFEDGQPLPLWHAYQPQPNAVRIREINGRLELDTPMPADVATALYFATDWALDSSKDFSVSVDFNFSDRGQGEGWVSVGVTPSSTGPASQYVDVAAGCLEGDPVYSGRQADEYGRQKWWAARPCDMGTLYISYDAASDELYRSFTGYGPVNAWHTASGLLKEQWAGKPLHVIIGGGSMGMTLKSGEDWLDDFSVDSGTVLP